MILLKWLGTHGLESTKVIANDKNFIFLFNPTVLGKQVVNINSMRIGNLNSLKKIMICRTSSSVWRMNWVWQVLNNNIVQCDRLDIINGSDKWGLWWTCLHQNKLRKNRIYRCPLPFFFSVVGDVDTVHGQVRYLARFFLFSTTNANASM